MNLKNQIFMVLALSLGGCSAKLVKPEVRPHKFKVGDCVLSWNEFEMKILGIWKADYYVLSNVNCNELMFSKNAIPFETAEEHSVVIDCPK